MCVVLYVLFSREGDSLLVFLVCKMNLNLDKQKKIEPMKQSAARSSHQKNIHTYPTHTADKERIDYYIT